MECPSCGREVAADARFCSACGTKLSGAAELAAASLSALMPAAERRQLTVMFIDLVGSTALASALDPEDLREVIGAYHGCVADTVAGWGGFVAKYMGDGVLVYFGYPQAHEDDAERAVRAGLAVSHAIQLLPGPKRLQVRVGVATGIVVVGDLVGSGEARERGVVGETPNLAARLQALAEPGTVVIGPATRRLLGGLFECRDLGRLDVKGFAAPVQAWQVVRPSAVESRFEALHAAALTPLVGRGKELRLLLRLWERAKGGKGQVVLLSGEPGIGKSRLIAALQERIRREPHTRLRYFCSPHHQDSALHPVINQLEHAAGFERDDDAAAKLGKLAALLARTAAPGEDVALVAELLSLPIPGADAVAPGLGPRQKKARTFAALARQLDGLARQAPVLMLFEDAHWVDPSSRELLDGIVGRAARLRMLLVVTFRPEFQPRWAGPHVTPLPLNRLDREDGEALVAQVLGGKVSSLPSGLVDEIVDRTDGVPLFIEELTKAVLEAGAGDTAATEASRVAPASLAIPATLHASLMARLDRLGAVAKEVAQIGAALGREFSHELIDAVAPTSEGAVDERLGPLVGSGLILRRGTPPGASYTFKHALVQDAAYGTLLRVDRQRLHARIARAFEERFPERVEREPELLAHHFAEAGQTERAIAYWRKAGERAVERSANVEAIRHLGRGLDALRALPESHERDRRELELQIAIGTPLIAVHGYSGPDTGAAYARARVLCERLGEAEPLVATLSGEFVHHFVRGDYPRMRRLVDEARQVAERLPDPMIRLAGHRLAGITAMQAGAFAEARSEFEAVLSLYDPGRHRSQPVHYVHDPQVSALTYLALVLWMLGFPEQARRSSAGAFRCAAELNQANLTAHVHNFAGAGLAELLGDASAVRAHAEAIIELADRHSLHYWRLNGLILRGWAMVQAGEAEAGIALMHQSAADRAAHGVSWYQPRYLCMLAATYGELGQAETGLRVIAEAKERVARHDESMWEAELERLEGELSRVRGTSAAAIEARFEQALATARRQGAHALELRAAGSLARLWRDEGRGRDGRDLLAPIYRSFTEGHQTRDLREARALLQELGEDA